MSSKTTSFLGPFIKVKLNKGKELFLHCIQRMHSLNFRWGIFIECEDLYGEPWGFRLTGDLIFARVAAGRKPCHVGNCKECWDGAEFPGHTGTVMYQ
jgi:hypothetical protein